MLFSYLNGTASIEEREWVKTWLEEHVDHRKKLEEFKVIYHWFRKGNAVGNGNKEESWNRIKAGYYKSGFLSVMQDRKSTNKRPVLRLSMAVAAAVIIAFIAGFYINSRLKKEMGFQDRLLTMKCMYHLARAHKSPYPMVLKYGSMQAAGSDIR